MLTYEEAQRLRQEREVLARDRYTSHDHPGWGAYEAAWIKGTPPSSESLVFVLAPEREPSMRVQVAVYDSFGGMRLRYIERGNLLHFVDPYQTTPVIKARRRLRVGRPEV